MTTKEKIINTAISLFNKNGFGAITMRQIADEMNVNRRNLTYHFGKDSLLEAIANQMWQKIEVEKQKRRALPSFENLDNEVKMYFQFQKEYAFIFNDLNVLRHPILAAKFKEMAMTSIKDNESAIAFAEKLGNINPEPFAGAYHNLCLSIWVLSFFWIPQQTIRGVEDENEIRRVIWSLILPHFTEKGIESFKAFFGKDFYENIGKPFEVEVKELFF